MYSQYSQIDINQLCRQKSISVLDKLPQINGPQLVTSLIRPLVSLINSKPNVGDDLLQCLHDDKDVLWIMEVIGYGLSLPFYDNEQIDAVRDCVNIYYEWFHALSPNISTNKFIPAPIRKDPNLYCQKILGHMYNIFRPRTFSSNDNINDLSSKQALFCHRILRLIINIATDKDNVIDPTTWECLLVFLLGINEELLKSQVHNEDIGTQIAERVISTLFEGWLLACVHCFPSPSYWKTFQNVCANLRHRPALIIQWNRVNVCLTNALVRLLYKGEDTLGLTKLAHFAQYNNIVILLSRNSLKQCWFRFLHIIGNPIELCFPEIVFKFDTQAVDSATLNQLPYIFHKAIKGLCTLVDIFLAVPNINLEELDYDIPKFHLNNQTQSVNSNMTPPEKRRSNFSLLNKDKQTHVKINSHRESKQSDNQNFTLPNVVLHSLTGNVFRQNQVKSTSVLDIFGKWLFQASLLCSSNNSILNAFNESLSESDNVSLNSLKGSIGRNEKSTYGLANLSLDNFEAGQAEAIGTLCRIFCFKKCDEDISLILSKQTHPDFQKIKIYLTSYYLALKSGLLSSSHENLRIQLLSSILVNSVWFFEVDLPGSKILIPHFLKSVEIFLTKKDKSNQPGDVMIRRACIKILISLLSFPLHFQDLPIRDTLSDSPSSTFLSLYPRLILLLVHGLYNEVDSVNIQMILGALLFIVEDSVRHEDLFVNVNGSNDDLISNLLTYFKIDYNNGLDNGNESDKSDIPCNIFLLIISFVAEILCKSSLKNSNDYNVSLAALEVLCSLGRIHYKEQYLCNNQCKLCIKQIFTFIENQCYKPATFHSKDMHSTIVAAYQCLSIWINEHSHLLKDKECIILLIEMIELGISGTKSKKDNQSAAIKSEKMLKPTSMRVKEVAEFLLSTLMGHMNGTSTLPSSESTILTCDLNELKIIEQILNLKPSQFPTNHFRYFIVENSLLISILERPSIGEETICIIRSPYGKYCWLLQYEHLSNSNKHNQTLTNEACISRSLSKADQHIRNGQSNYFPEFFDKICTSKFDNMVLKLSDYINGNDEIKKEQDIMQNLIEKIENNLKFEKTKLTINSTKKEFSEPLPSKNFDPSRLILSQFKAFNFDVCEENRHNLSALNANSAEFVDCIEKLDMISNKNNDIVTIMYIPKCFNEESEIFQANSYYYKNNGPFRDFMLSLGDGIECSTNSFNANILYWSDISHELLFISPTLESEKSFSLVDLIKEDNESIKRTLLKGDHCSNQRIKSYLMNNVGCDIKLLVFWLENMEDFGKLPLKQMENHSTNDDCEFYKEKLYVVVINPLKNGLFKVVPHSFGGRCTSVWPSIDRMLLNKELLAPYIRMTALNLFRRRRMNAESYQLPHVKRRFKIQEIANKFKMSYPNKQLITDLFTNKFM